MGLAAISLAVEFARIDCGKCGGVYAISERFREHKREKGGFWHCPYCECSWGYDPNGTELARARRDAEEASARAATAQRMLKAEQNRHRRTKKRAAAALCPCCNRSFVQLRRHLATKHPEYKGA